MPRTMLKALLSLFAALLAAEIALVGAVGATAAIRRRGQKPPSEGFPWEEQPEIEPESGDERLRLYPEYEGLYEAMIEEIEGARERIFIETFIWQADEWGERFVDALAKAATRGVDVEVLIPERSNHALVDWLGRSFLGELLGAGARIFEYRDFMLHAKTATVDGIWSTVGSSNVDTLSFFGLNESNLEVYSENLAARMERMFELDKTNARELTLEGWKARPTYDKALQWGIAPLRLLG